MREVETRKGAEEKTEVTGKGRKGREKGVLEDGGRKECDGITSHNMISYHIV